ncbi:SDR family oxidoreductase [soil metagenome]
MTIAVTGATGQLGQLVIAELLKTQDPASLVAIVRDPSKAVAIAELGVEVRAADYADPAALKTALAGVDKLLLISGNQVGQRVAQHTNVIDAAIAAGVRFVVYTSAPKATTSTLILAPEHKATEEYLTASGLPFAIARHGWYTENYAAAVETAKVTGTVVAAASEGKIASASRVDFAAGDVAILLGEGHEGKVYEFGGDHAWDFNELASTIGEVIGRDVVYQPVSKEVLVDILKTHAGLDDGTANFVAALDVNTAEGVLGEVTGELSALIGRPTTPLLEGLKSL